MNELPLKFKSQILRFARMYEELASPRQILVTIRTKSKVNVVWESDNSISVYDDTGNWEYDHCKEIVVINKKIKRFVQQTENFGRTHFKNKSWLWENVLWNYRPECGEKFNSKKQKWVG